MGHESRDHRRFRRSLARKTIRGNPNITRPTTIEHPCDSQLLQPLPSVTLLLIIPLVSGQTMITTIANRTNTTARRIGENNIANPPNTIVVARLLRILCQRPAMASLNSFRRNEMFIDDGRTFYKETERSEMLHFAPLRNIQEDIEAINITPLRG